jgi:hypothetical protein
VHLDFVELGLRAAVQRDAAAMLGQLLGETLWAGRPAARSGEKCYHGRAKTIATVFGPVNLRRDYLYEPGAGEGRVPLDERLGLLEGYSPGLAKMMSRVGAQQSDEAGVADLLAYGRFRAQGYFIGSGVVEAGCRTVVGQRLKNSGMFWSTAGAQNVLTLRTALLGNHFDADWNRRSSLAA